MLSFLRLKSHTSKSEKGLTLLASNHVENRNLKGLAMSSSKGFTLMEMVVVTAVFAIISLAMYQGYSQILTTARILKVRAIATNVANEQIEIARNLPYDDVGTVGGIPSGIIPPVQTIVREGNTFTVTTTARNIDELFDGTIGGFPNDLSPADNKLVEIEVSCALCQDFSNLVFNTHVAPESLESLSSNGALRINVFDANGENIDLANVSLVNTAVSPNININDVTGNNGMLMIVDAPPSVESYQITVTKPGYSTDKTYTINANNPNPVKPHATVSQGQITSVSFTIDETSTIAVSSVTDTCVAVPSVDFDLASATLIGTNPNVLKYDDSHTTNSNGLLNLSNMEWGTYTVTPTDTAYDVVGFVPMNIFDVTPGIAQDLKLTVAPKDSSTLVVSVKDQGTKTLLSNASVQIQKTGVDKTQTTGQSQRAQTDWSGGAGQENYTNETQYMSQDGFIIETTPGQLTLVQDEFGYVATGTLISSTFDFGPGVEYGTLRWGEETPSSTDIVFQIATTSSGTPTNFVGPDGTAGTFFTTSGGTDLDSSHDGQRYLRYKIYLSTAAIDSTPILNNLEITFSGDCVPEGQTAFQGLGQGTYTVTATLSGYQQLIQNVDLASTWQELFISITP